LDTVGQGRPNVMAYTAAAVAAAHAGSWTLALQARFASSECYPPTQSHPHTVGHLEKPGSGVDATLKYFEIL